jgi:hypothetical protein
MPDPASVGPGIGKTSYLVTRCRARESDWDPIRGRQPQLRSGGLHGLVNLRECPAELGDHGCIFWPWRLGEGVARHCEHLDALLYSPQQVADARVAFGPSGFSSDSSKPKRKSAAAADTVRRRRRPARG